MAFNLEDFHEEDQRVGGVLAYDFYRLCHGFDLYEEFLTDHSDPDRAEDEARRKRKHERLANMLFDGIAMHEKDSLYRALRFYQASQEATEEAEEEVREPGPFDSYGWDHQSYQLATLQELVSMLNTMVTSLFTDKDEAPEPWTAYRPHQEAQAKAQAKPKMSREEYYRSLGIPGV